MMTSREKQKVYSFGQELKKGELGEKVFFSRYQKKPFAGQLEWADKIIRDFYLYLESSRYGLELKTDFWRIETTPNFFIEKYSNEDSKSLGGPFRAFRDNVDLFVYFFIRTGETYVFKTSELYHAVCDTDESKLVPVYNEGWVAKGFKIQRKSLRHICRKFYLPPSWITSVGIDI